MRRSKKTLASRLKHRIDIEQPVEVADGGGGFTTSWQNFTTIWAEVKPLRGREVFDDDQIQDIKNFRITIRYMDNITTRMRIMFDERYFNIRAVINPDEGAESLELLCEEGVAI